jgi:epoxyqueuosine reductase QueG
MTLSDELQTFLQSKGADLVGFADLREIDADTRDDFLFGISIGVALNPQIMSEIKDGPTRQYHEEYNRANSLLDTLGQSTAEFFRENGYDAKNFTATGIYDPVTLSTRLPHKTVATRAGLGWVGKCALLVTKQFGSAIRFNTVLTNAQITVGQPINTSQCGDCTDCVDICPAKALSGKNWQVGHPRESLYDAFACRKTAHALAMKRIGIRETICGLCIVSCPWTQKYVGKSGQHTN